MPSLPSILGKIAVRGGVFALRADVSWGYFGHDEALHGVVFFDTSAVKNGFGMVSPPFFGGTGVEKKGGAGMAQMPRAHDRLPRRDWGKRLF